MSDILTFDQIADLGKRKVGDVKTVEIPALNGSVKIRQISAAEHDAAIAAGNETDTPDAHIIAREQIKAALVEPALPEDEATDIISGLPVAAFGQLHSIVMAHSGLGLSGVEELVKMFRDSADRLDPTRVGENDDHATDALDGAGLGATDTDPSGEVAGDVSLASEGAGTSAETSGANAASKVGKVTDK